MPAPKTSVPEDLTAQLALRLRGLRDSMLRLEAEHGQMLHAVSPRYKQSARNLVHYLAMRQQDLRALQTDLAALGLSSLGRAEASALFFVEAVLGVLDRLAGNPISASPSKAPCDLSSGMRLLDAHAKTLFGAEAQGRSARIMVTMPSEAARDYTLVRTLLESGMDCMRINCAHDQPGAWLQMIEHLRHARKTLGRNCSILMDLAGPKLRTGPIEAGPGVKKIRPVRDALGNVTAPAIVWLTSATAPAEPPSAAACAVLQVAPEWLAAMEVAQRAGFYDTRGRFRVLTAASRDNGGIWAELRSTAYITNGTVLERMSPGAGEPVRAEVAGIPAIEGTLTLRPGDLLTLTRDPSPGRPPTYDSAHQMLSPARIACTLPDVFADLRPGEKVCLDDGKIVGIAESVSSNELHVRIQRTPPQGARLKADKGINLPETDLNLPALTIKDRADLAFAVRQADLIGLSFVNRESDVLALVEILKGLEEPRPGLVLKIETQRGFARLPSLLLTAMRHDRIGVMIARGDLAVECGYERLAEAQEEILWMCEAAHCPAIWATQVLETLAKQGTPSRAEITDAAMGNRAECVMLNKGPHIEQAVHVLDDILRRMESHQSKKRSMLRTLRMATSFSAAVDGEQASGAGALVAHARTEPRGSVEPNPPAVAARTCGGVDVPPSY
jgi:pyruvate kinase